MLHEVYEKDGNLQAHLKIALELTSKVSYSSSCKYIVLEALAIFHPTTFAIIKMYFADRDAAAEFLNLINSWWITLNVKDQ